MWHYFVEFTGLTGDEILESRKADKKYDWEKKVIEFKDWLINVKGQSENSATTATSTVRGFFSYHRLSLKFRRSESVRLTEAKPKFIDYRFSRDDLKKMNDVADLQERYILTAGKSFGLRAGDFLKLTRGDLEPYLDRPVPISIGEYATQKESVKAFPFIDSDALPVIKLIIEKMDREGKTKPTDKILTFSHPIQLTRVIKRITENAGIKIGSKRVRFHCMRKFLTDRLSSYMSESKWKQIVGKKVSEIAYVSPNSLRQDYIRAMKETCFPKEAISEEERRIQATFDNLRLAGFSEDKIEAYKKQRGKTWSTAKELITIFREKAKQPITNNRSTNCANGEHCGEEFKEIAENELLIHLNSGWRITHNLQNGKVIIQRG